jgi:hypothetical protein
MTATFTDSLAAKRFQPSDFSRQGLTASRPNPFDSLPEKFERKPQSDLGFQDLLVQSLPGIVVQMIVQQTGFNGNFSGFGGFGIKIVMTETRVPLKAAPLKYTKNGILVHHTGKTISSEDVANALAEE